MHDKVNTLEKYKICNSILFNIYCNNKYNYTVLYKVAYAMRCYCTCSNNYTALQGHQL